MAVGIQAPTALTLHNTPDQITYGGKQRSTPAELHQVPVLTYHPWKAAGEGRCSYLI